MRRGFTLVEALVATGAASIILVLLYSALVFYSRAFTREDESLERGRRSQEILSLLRDDVERAGGYLAGKEISTIGLKAVGFAGTGSDFVLTPHVGNNLINSYRTLQAQTPYASKRYNIHEGWKVNPRGGDIERDPLSSQYFGDQPPSELKKYIPPLTARNSIVAIQVPLDNPRAFFWGIRKVKGDDNDPAVILWSFHKDPHGPYPADTLLRWAPFVGVKNVGGEQLVKFDLKLFYDYFFVDKLPPKRPEPVVQYMKMQVQCELEFGRTKVNGPEPGFEIGAWFLVGP